jgi:uncharacterized membrane protein (DUF485 family)
MPPSAPDWQALAADPAFRALHAAKSRFLWRLLAFAVLFYLLLPAGAAWWTDLFRVPVWGAINLGLVFAFAQFGVAWGVAVWYARRARRFDAMAAAIAARAPGAGQAG